MRFLDWSAIPHGFNIKDSYYRIALICNKNSCPAIQWNEKTMTEVEAEQLAVQSLDVMKKVFGNRK